MVDDSAPPTTRVNPASATEPFRTSAFVPRAQLGRYLFIEELGRGGMGVVLRAYDPKLQREIALKILKGTRQPEALARMVREARAMAKVSHANVVQVYDVDFESTDDVLIAMEFVEGTDLRRWLETDRSWRELLEVFVAAGRGLAAAHGAGLLHRDFKPANVLCGSTARPQTVKVTDFGLARASHEAISSPISESLPASSSGHDLSTDLTEAGQVMGTPVYMAPEQHLGHELDPRSDQYAFCVALWEALTGRRPFSGSSNELARRKLKGPPPWPRDRDVPRALSSALLRGLSPERDDRFPDMTALLAKLESALGSSGRRRLVAAAAAGLGLTAVALVTTRGDERCSGSEAELATAWNEARRARASSAFEATHRPYAPGAWQRAQARLDDYGQRWTAMHHETCVATQIRREQSEATMDMRMACLRRARSSLRATADVFATADADVVRRADQLASSLPSLDRCEDIDALTAEVRPPGAELRADVEAIADRVAEAKVARIALRLEPAGAAIDEAIAAARTTGYGPLLAEALQEKGRIEDLHQNRAASSIAAHDEALSIATRESHWVAAAAACVSLAYVHGGQRNTEAALAYAKIGAALAERTPRPLHARASVANSLGAMYYALGDYPAAEAEFAKSLRLGEQSGDDDVGGTRSNLGDVLSRQGKYEEAIELYRLTIAQEESQGLADHPTIAEHRSDLGNALARIGRDQEAQTQLRRAIEISTDALGSQDARTIGYRQNLAIAHSMAGRHEEAADEYRASIEGLAKVLGPDHPNVGGSRMNYSQSLLQLGRLDEAETQLQAALEAWLDYFGPDHPNVASVHANLGQVLLAQERFEDALVHLERGWVLKRDAPITPRSKAAAAFNLAQALWALNRDSERTEQLLTQAVEFYEQAAPAGAEDLKEVRQWIDNRPPR